MADELRITVSDIRALNLCTQGQRRWFEAHGLDFKLFLAEGIAANALLATGDVLALRVIEAKRARQELGRG